MLLQLLKEWDRTVAQVAASTSRNSLLLLLPPLLIILLSIAAAARGSLEISPSEDQFKVVNSGVIFTCSIPGFVYDGSSIPDIRWKNAQDQIVDATEGRVYVEKDGINSIKLYLTRIYEGDAGLYTCQYEKNGDVERAYIKLSLYEDISFEETETYIRAAVGTGASPLLPCIASGQPEPEISWRFQNRKLANGNNDNAKYRYETGGLRIFNLKASDNGTYECRAEELSQGKFQVRRITLDVSYPPVIHGGPTSHTAVEGEQVDLRCDASGNPALTYQWFREQKMSDMIKMKVRLQQGNSPMYTIGSMRKEDVGRYYCRVSNGLGTAESFGDISIIIPPTINKLPHKAVLEGSTVVIPCEASGDPKPSITWKKEGNSEEYVEGTQPSDSNIQVITNQEGFSKLTIFGIRRSYAGVYICIARNTGGETSKRAPLTVNYLPTASISETELLGWPGQVRNITCVAAGLPSPNVNWFRGSQYITNSDIFRVVTKKDRNRVISTVTIDIGKETWLYDRYNCIAKNEYDYDTASVVLKEAKLPGMPKGIKHQPDKLDTILLEADFPENNGTFPVTGWKIEYEAEGHKQSGVQFYSIGEPLRLKDLIADTVYHLSISCGSEIGYGPPAKFQVKTPSGSQADLPRDVEEPIVKQEEEDKEKPLTRQVDYGVNKVNANVNVKKAKSPENEMTMSTGIVAGVTVGVVIILCLIFIIVCIVRRKKRQNASFYNERKQVEYGGNIYMTAGTDVDNLQLGSLRRKNSPLPDVVHPDRVKSPMENRKTKNNRSVDSNLVNLAGKTPTLQKQAWEQMKMKQDEIISDEEEEEDDEFTDEVEDGGEDLPHPPAYLLNTRGGEEEPNHYINSLRDEDCESYQDIIEGYHSGDNMDELEEADFELRVPSGCGQNTYVSYDPVT